MAETTPTSEQKAENDGMLDVGDLVRMFEDSEEATQEARGLAERDRDYYDNIQFTDEELVTLRKRGQPPVIDNRIKTKIDYLIGMEKSQRIKPRALPRTPAHEDDADGASQALDYVADTEDYNSKRSGVWRNLLIEGSGGISVAVEIGRDGPEIKLRRWSWDRMFADPHSAEADYSDAGYLGGVIWMDYDDALAQYPDGKDILDATMTERASLSQTYDDKPKFRVWADSKRRRVRIVQIWVKRDNQWYFAEFTKGGILKAGPSPYVDDKGESECEMIFQSAYVNRENERYGLVREMVSLQDAINKRSSKSLHLLSVAQTIYEDGAIEDIQTFRRERAKPDGTMKVAPGALANNQIKTDFQTDLAASHFQLLQDAKNSIDLKGPNATMMGDKAQGSSSASGRAIIASQQGGMIQLGDLMDNLRHLDKRVFRAIWSRIRQFWTGEKWIRVTDDERNVKWVAMNVDPRQIQMAMQQNPQMAEKIAGAIGNVAELDCDIIIDEVPDSTVPQLEQFQTLAELKKFDTGNEIPFRAIVAAVPNLKDRQAFLQMMDKRAEENAKANQVAEQLKMRGAVAEVTDKEQSAFQKKTAGILNLARAQEAGTPEAPQVGEPQLPMDIQAAQALADVDATRATADHKRAQAAKTMQDMALAPRQMAHQMDMDRAQRNQPQPA